MVQLRILSGSKAGGFQVVRRFPFHVGRAADNDLCFDSTGVWDYHFMLNLQPHEGFAMQTFDEAFATVNDEHRNSAILRNGDVISFGSAKVQFWLAAPVQRSLRFREFLIWAFFLFITLGQVALVHYLFTIH